jgi:hypothetical protein
MRLSAELVEVILLSGRAGDRYLNETSIQPEVWKAFAQKKPDAPLVDLLLTPLQSKPAADLARELFKALFEEPAAGQRGTVKELTPLEGFVAVSMDFQTFARLVLPATGVDVRSITEDLINIARARYPSEDTGFTVGDLARLVIDNYIRDLSPDHRMLVVVLLMASPGPERVVEAQDLLSLAEDNRPVEHTWTLAERRNPTRRIWQVSLNREIERLTVSVETVKADAAWRLFDMSCRDITWAVIDSGIDGSHPAFRDHEAGGFSIRVDKALDFSRLRRFASYDILGGPAALRDELVAEVCDRTALKRPKAEEFLRDLSEDARRGRPFDWEILSKLLECKCDKLEGERPNGHGTHVAGVLGGDWREGESIVHQGVCPDIRLYDLRVLGITTVDTEFAILGALEYVRWLNSRNRYLSIHGVNLSVGIQHDFKNFACGQTPVCRSADATVHSGVVVVAAAGNWGSQDFLTSTGPYRGYAPISIADPGNTESVITVGSTHRERPHEYGVSFFSSRGPTGDGRAKPDLVAPGERIDGPLPNLGYGRLDGTSMAAPHVSGVAALLLARHPEFIGKPFEVKRILMQAATDLGRERHFQGAGLVDALRALQSV